MAFPKEITIKLSRDTIGEGQILYTATVSTNEIIATGYSPEKIKATIKAIQHFETKFTQKLKDEKSALEKTLLEV